MRKLLFILLAVSLIWTPECIYAQDVQIENNKIGKSKKPIKNNIQRAKFKGNINQFLWEHLTYPDLAIKKEIEGVVVVEFIVEESGAVRNAKVVKGIGGGCDEEAIRVVMKTSGLWTPGIYEGEYQPSYFILPISFKLQENTED